MDDQVAGPVPVSAGEPTAPAADRAGRGRLRTAERTENFPVALRVLPARVRGHLRAIYDVVRTVDDIGDDPDADPATRLARLDALDADLELLWSAGDPVTPVVRRLAPTVAACAVPHAPFADLIEANRRDQRITRYATRDELLGYCALSAAPIGRLVLAVAERGDDPDLVALSDRVCAALQLLEHWADVGEDRGYGRIYLPASDRAEFGVAEEDLDAPVATAALAGLVRHETAWALELLGSGLPVVSRLHGWARVAVAGYVAGGLAAADAVVRVDGDVLGHPARTRRRDVVRHLVAVLTKAVTR